METKTDLKDTISEALKGNELINGMNTFIDHIHHITLENKKLKEHIKEQQQVFQNEKDELLAELSHSHYYYGQLKESKDFYEKMFTDLRSTLARSQSHS